VSVASIARHLTLALDAAAFSRAAHIAPDPWQERFLRSAAPQLILNASRQSGKSTCTAVLAVHTALYQPGSLVLLASPSLRQSGELFRKALDVYHAVGEPIPAHAESALRLDLGNGSRIVSLPGKEGTIRGYSGVRLLVIDEAAYVPDELYQAVRPMLAVSQGRIVLLSTPHGTRGAFYEAWQSSEDWERFEVPATDCPRIPASFLERERRSMGSWWFDQEFGCRFLDAQTAAFAREDVDALFEKPVESWDWLAAS